ncbi:MAG: hypothetical protein ABR591_06720 [Candidatus Velthaea sp.]
MSSDEEASAPETQPVEHNRRRGDRRRAEGAAPETVGERRGNDRRKTPGFMALIHALLGHRNS